MKKSGAEKLFDVIIGAFAGMGIGFFVWMIASWVDVILHNTTTFTYANWNLFQLLMK